MLVKSNSVFVRLVDRVLPRTPDFFSLVDDQCDQAVRTLDELVHYMECRDGATGEQVRKMEKQGDELKRRNLDVLNRAFSTPMDREDIYRAIIDVDHVMNYAKSTVREMELLGVTPDRYTLEMSKHLRAGTVALQEGFRLLRKNAPEAEKGADAAHKAERNVEKVYRKALVELFEADFPNGQPGTVANRSWADGDREVLQIVMDKLKRREIYRHMSNAADRMARAGNTLHDIVVKIV